MQRRFLIALAAVLLLAGTVSASAGAAEPRASLPDIEDEVMCPTCGTALNLANSPQAERERVFIRRQIEQGKTKAQIKDALVAEFGSEVLALPDDEGFDLTAYLVPAGAVLIAAVALGFGLVRWRRTPDSRPQPEPELSAADSARLEQDLSRYDL
jgi:cytochrome c-type biogenesis protein CcmH